MLVPINCAEELLITAVWSAAIAVSPLIGKPFSMESRTQILNIPFFTSMREWDNNIRKTPDDDLMLH